MKQVYHILNGDSLKYQLKDLKGEIIVLRECLVEGNVAGDSLEEIINSRIKFFDATYNIGEVEYRDKSANELNKITTIQPDRPIYLWFENDLFCQVNLWFAIASLYQLGVKNKLYLVSPIGNSWRGFGDMDNESLMEAFDYKQEISMNEQKVFMELWQSYQISDWEGLRKNAVKLTKLVTPIIEVVEAHIDRFPDRPILGRPQQSLLGIKEEMEEPTFGKIFQAFCESDGIYGFGDMQVKRILDEMDR